MADVTYNVPALFQAAFGINSPVYITEPLQNQAPANISFQGFEVLPDYYSEDSLKSWMGTPIIFPAKFMGGSYKKYKDNGEIERVSMDTMYLPPATMFFFRRAHNVTRTELLGNNGTVKEIFGFDDWVIDARGLCLDEPTQSAHSQLMQMLQWEKLADSFGVAGRLFEQREISSVCISDWNDNVVQGKPGVIAFQFQMYSDENIILVL